MILDLKGVGQQTAAKFNKLGIVTIADLTQYYPKEHEDRRTIVAIKEIVVGEVNNIMATVLARPDVMNTSRGIRVSVTVGDRTGKVRIIFFGQPYLKSTFIMGETYNFYGKVTENFEMNTPEFQKRSQYKEMIVPVYASTAKLSQKVIRQHIKTALQITEIKEFLPEEILSKFKLVGKQEAVNNIHFPDTPEEPDAVCSHLYITVYYLFISSFKSFFLSINYLFFSRYINRKIRRITVVGSHCW